MDLYAVLGLSAMADQAAIRNAYRRLAKLYHPDVSSLPDAHARFLAIAEAHQVLSNPVTRARYDRTLQRAAARQARPPRPAATPRKTASHARYDRTYSRQRREARAQARAHSRMSYAEFDTHIRAHLTGYVAPKILGCLGMGAIGVAVIALLVAIFHRVEWLMLLVGMFALFGFIPALAYASTKFDGWHDKKQGDKRGR